MITGAGGPESSVIMKMSEPGSWLRACCIRKCVGHLPASARMIVVAATVRNEQLPCAAGAAGGAGRTGVAGTADGIGRTGVAGTAGTADGIARVGVAGAADGVGGAGVAGAASKLDGRDV